MSANLPIAGDIVVSTGQGGRMKGVRYKVAAVTERDVAVRTVVQLYGQEAYGAEQHVAREVFWLVFEPVS